MSRWIEEKWLNKRIKDSYRERIGLDSAPSIELVRCKECRRIREDGGHANCGGYLYCRKWKTLVDEDSYCSWGKERASDD